MIERAAQATTTATANLYKPYQAVPGTIPYRVLEHFRDLPPGTELSLATLAEDLDIQLRGLGALLSWPRERGALKARRRPGDTYMLWSLGDGEPHPCVDDEPEPIPAQAWPIGKGTAVSMHAANDAATDASFGCTLLDSGQLDLHLGPTTISLAPSHTRALFRYLDQLAAAA